MAKQRKVVSWRVADHSESEILNQWLDKQNNIQESISNIILHIIDQYGCRNITDYEIQKALYQRVAFNHSPSIHNQPVITQPVVQEAPIPEPPIENNPVRVNDDPVKEETIIYEETENKVQSDDNDPNDIYGQVDMNNL